MSVKLKRTIQEWRNLDPVNIAQRQGRPVAKHALVDAKHDILALAARVEELEDRQHIEIAPLSLSASLVLPEREGAALTSDLSARINRVSRRSLDGAVIMSSEEWNGIVKKVEKLLTAPQPAEQQPAPAVQGEQGVKWAPEEVANGNKGIRWVSDEGVHGRPTDHDCRVYLESNPNARGCHCPECTTLYTAPQPAPDASGLVVTLKSIEEWVMRYADPKHPVATVARKALADYRKQGGEA